MALTLDALPVSDGVVDHRATLQEQWRRPFLLLIGIELVVLFGPTVSWLVDRWTMSVWQNAHGMFVPPFVAWLAWHELKDRSDLPRQGSGWGFALLAPALALHAIDAGMHTQLLSAFAMFLAIPGIALLLLGGARTRLIALPLAFLLFAMPIPLAFTESLQLVLRHFVSTTIAALLPVLGVSVFLEGTALQMTNGIVQIADACSGWSTLYAALTVACLVAYMAPSGRRRALVLVAAVPVAIVANLLRVLALTLMVAWGQAWLLDTFVHPLSGMMTFALALPVIFWLGGLSKPAVQR
ncbi:MAG: exosortase/archaeosortase family protein [Vicinamibacterales bacterium]